MFLTNNGTIPDYYSLYQMAKPIYAYYSSLTHLVEKSEKHTVIMGEREITPLLALIERIINLKAHLPSLEESFCIARFFEMRKLIVMTRPQLQAKKRLFSIIKLTNINDSIAYLAQLLYARIQIINTLSRPHFALPIPSTCLKIGLQLLFSPYTESKIHRLGSGAFGVVDTVTCMDQVCAKKTIRNDLEERLLQEIFNGARLTLQMTNPQIPTLYHILDNNLFFESGLTDCDDILKNNPQDFIFHISNYVEDLLRGFSMMHFGTANMARIISKKRRDPLSKERHYILSEGAPPIVHGDFKTSNCVLFEETSQRRRTVKIIDMDTICYTGTTISEVICTYEYNSPEAAIIYLNPLGFERNVSIYDDSWSLGCFLYRIFFQQHICQRGLLTSQNPILKKVVSITQIKIDEKLELPLDPYFILTLGRKEFLDCYKYFKKKYPGCSLSTDQKRELQMKLGIRELMRQDGIIRGLLTVNLAHRLTVDQAHHIYYMAERKLSPILDRKLKVNAATKLSPIMQRRIKIVAERALSITIVRKSKLADKWQLNAAQIKKLKLIAIRRLKLAAFKKLRLAAEKRFSPIKEIDFDNPTADWEEELSFLNQEIAEIPLKITGKVCIIQKAFRNYLSKKRNDFFL